jgi:hypothetical protein
MNRLALLVMLVVVALGTPGRLGAQDPQPRHLTVNTGVFDYELLDSGLAPMLAVRGAMPVSSVLMVEVGVVGSRPKQMPGQNSTFLAPEAQAQLTLPFNTVIPYMGLGFGAVLDFRSAEMGGTQADMTISGSLGMRAWFTNQVGAQAEFRGRGIGVDFQESSAEYSVGLAMRF